MNASSRRRRRHRRRRSKERRINEFVAKLARAKDKEYHLVEILDVVKKVTNRLFRVRELAGRSCSASELHH